MFMTVEYLFAEHNHVIWETNLTTRRAFCLIPTSVFLEKNMSTLKYFKAYICCFVFWIYVLIYKHAFE